MQEERGLLFWRRLHLSTGMVMLFSSATRPNHVVKRDSPESTSVSLCLCGSNLLRDFPRFVAGEGGAAVTPVRSFAAEERWAQRL